MEASVMRELQSLRLAVETMAAELRKFTRPAESLQTTQKAEHLNEVVRQYGRDSKEYRQALKEINAN